MKYLSSFEVRTFRNVIPTTLRFRPGLNIVLGKNATGKTSLLRLLSDSLEGLLLVAGEDRDIQFEVVDDIYSFRRSIYQATPKAPKLSILSLAPGLTQRERFEWRKSGDAEWGINASVDNGKVQIDGEGDSTASTSPLVAVLQRLFERKMTQVDREQYLSLAVCDSPRMDEGLDYFNAVLAFELRRKGSEWPVSSMLRGAPKSFSTLFEREFRIEKNGASILADFLKEAAEIMGYEDANAFFDVESKATGTITETTLRNLRLFFNSSSEHISHSSLSYGEKRLIAFMALSDASDILVVDELVNGLHHEWIKACLDKIGNRQAFLTSQNPLLLDYLEFENAQDVESGFILCEKRKRADGTGSELCWRNPTSAEAGEFFEAYRTGIQRVSDILINKGFW